MNNIESTKTTKARRENMLIKFLQRIQRGEEWKKWLNSDGELYISKVCVHLGEEEGGKAWDTSFFRGAGWGVPYKEEFNKWVRWQQKDTDLFTSDVSRDLLPSYIKTADLPEDVRQFIVDKVFECKRLQERNVVLAQQIDAKEKRVLELKTEIEDLRSAQHNLDDHYLFSIRTLRYD